MTNPCPMCDGEGKIDCPRCAGVGYIKGTNEMGEWSYRPCGCEEGALTCPACKGTGEQQGIVLDQQTCIGLLCISWAPVPNVFSIGSSEESEEELRAIFPEGTAQRIDLVIAWGKETADYPRATLLYCLEPSPHGVLYMDIAQGDYMDVTEGDPEQSHHAFWLASSDVKALVDTAMMWVSTCAMQAVARIRLRAERFGIACRMDELPSVVGRELLYEIGRGVLTGAEERPIGSAEGLGALAAFACADERQAFRDALDRFLKGV